MMSGTGCQQSKHCYRLLIRLVLALLTGWMLWACGRSPNTELDHTAIDERIRKHRTTVANLTLLDTQSAPLRHTPVLVKMRRHKFLFGCNLYRWSRFNNSEYEEIYRRRFAALFNFATLPFYWGSFEPKRGQRRPERVEGMADWCDRHGIQAKGHPLVWHEVAAAWQTDLGIETLKQLQLKRVKHEVETFRRRIDIWDVVNEAVAMSDSFEPIGRLGRDMGVVELIAAAFGTARKANPKAMLVLNDYRHDKTYAKLIERSLKIGAPIDAIGLQSHMHPGYSGTSYLWEICERFARFNKPLHWTEITIVSGRLKTWADYEPVKNWHTTPKGEQRQAEQVVEMYSLLFSHPAVGALTWWDFSDNGAWLLAPAGLLREDMSPKPAYEALHKLIKKEWWTGPLSLTSDGSGRVSFRGFLGAYELQIADQKVRFNLDAPGEMALTISMAATP